MELESAVYALLSAICTRKPCCRSCLVATVITVEADVGSARGQREELDVITVRVTHVKASVL